jgi:hypothetical protein
MAGAPKVGGILSVLRYLIPPFLKQPLREAANRWACRHGYVPFDMARHYAEDGLFTVHSDEFRRVPRFQDSYQRGVLAGQGVDPGIRWRVHVALWAAELATRAPGDFVECGVNAGMISSAVMRYLDWGALPRRYFLIDTFSGPVLSQFSAEEHQSGWVRLVEQQVASGGYVTDLERVRANFAEWPNAVIAQGTIPDVLPSVQASPVAFLHLDLNCAGPEAAALAYFWPRMHAGAVVLMDDYAHHGAEPQKRALDAWARQAGAAVLSLPTGQGLIVR